MVCVLFLRTWVGAGIICYVSFVSFWCFVLFESAVCLQTFELQAWATFACVMFGLMLMHSWVSVIITGYVGTILFYMLCCRNLSCIHLNVDTLKFPPVFVAFYVLDQIKEFRKMQGAEVLVGSLLFRLR